MYLLLERPRAALFVLGVLLAIHTCLLGYSAYVHSPTLNEPAHLVAGISYWKFGRFDIYNVNPPLVRMVAALPVMAVGYNEDWSGFYEGPGARPEMGMGEALVRANGERSFFLFMIARWACVPFSWLGATVCFLWARDLYGRPAGVMAAAIWCFEPNILAHASLITPDAHATALGLVACYTFWRWLKRPSWTQAALTGVVLGFAELAKTTLILFYPLWPMMWVLYRWPDRKHTPWLRETGMLTLRMVIGLYVLNLGYAFEEPLTPLKDFHFVSDLFAGRESSVENRGTDSGQFNPQPPTRSLASVNRFAGSWLGSLPVPFPKNYLMGIDIQQKDFEHYGTLSYLRGVWQDHGWWYYYLYACAIKVPLGLWALGSSALGLSLRTQCGNEKQRSNNQRFRPPLRDEFTLLFPAVTIFVTVSAKTGFSEHMRYVLPAFPYFFVLMGQIVQVFAADQPGGGKYLTKVVPSRYNHGRIADSTTKVHGELVQCMALRSITIGCLLWVMSSSMWIFPHSLCYFNESIGGPFKGPNHLLGSNVDWGQDLRYVKSWLNAVRDFGPRYFIYRGGVDPATVGIDGFQPVVKNVDKALMNEVVLLQDGKAILPTGWYLISVDLSHGSAGAAYGGGLQRLSIGSGALGFVGPLRSGESIGYTMKLFRVVK